MSYHSFSLDPRTVLGVGPDASLDEIRDAYHAKSKKHHPDLGGDEWAFRMVARAYEVLKTTAATPSTHDRGVAVSRMWGNGVRRRIGVGSGVLRLARPVPHLQADSGQTADATATQRPSRKTMIGRNRGSRSSIAHHRARRVAYCRRGVDLDPF